jgi:hypothetical protein
MKRLTDAHGYELLRISRFWYLTAPANAFKSAGKRIGTFLMRRVPENMTFKRSGPAVFHCLVSVHIYIACLRNANLYFTLTG